MPVCVSGQTRPSAPNEVVWHWYGVCASGDSLVLEVRLDGNALYSSTFAICQVRRREIKPEPQQRILEFRFDGEPHRFRSRYHTSGTQPIDGSIWEGGGDRQAGRPGTRRPTGRPGPVNTNHRTPPRPARPSERRRRRVIPPPAAPRGSRLAP